jgi:hypothetical protein
MWIVKATLDEVSGMADQTHIVASIAWLWPARAAMAIDAPSQDGLL